MCNMSSRVNFQRDSTRPLVLTLVLATSPLAWYVRKMRRTLFHKTIDEYQKMFFFTSNATGLLKNREMNTRLSSSRLTATLFISLFEHQFQDEHQAPMGIWPKTSPTPIKLPNLQ